MSPTLLRLCCGTLLIIALSCSPSNFLISPTLISHYKIRITSVRRTSPLCLTALNNHLYLTLRLQIITNAPLPSHPTSFRCVSFLSDQGSLINLWLKMVRIDRYKSAARYEARCVDDDVSTFNPWAFRHKRSRPEDEEDPARRINTHQSENVMESSAAQYRRHENEDGLPAPNHANTEPPSSSPTSPTDAKSRAFESSTRDMAYEGAERNERSQDSGTGTSDTLGDKESIPSEGSLSSRLRNRRRKRDLLKPSMWISKRGESQPKKPKKHGLFSKDEQQFSPWSQVRATVFNSWINILLLFVPVGIAAKYAGLPSVAVFVLNFIAIIPLAAMLSFVTEELAIRVGETLGGLLNASFG